jgi:hypothetical protein
MDFSASSVEVENMRAAVWQIVRTVGLFPEMPLPAKDVWLDKLRAKCNALELMAEISDLFCVEETKDQP